MATTTRQPDGDGTIALSTIVPTTPTTHFDKVDEGVPGNDTTDYVEHNGNSTAADFYTIEDMPGDFDVAVDSDISMRTEIAGVVDDTVQITGQAYQTGEVSPVTGAPQANKLGNHSWATTTTTPGANTEDDVTWDGHKIRVEVFRSNAGMPDAVTARCTAVEVHITYDVVGVDARIPGIRQSRVHHRTAEIARKGI